MNLKLKYYIYFLILFLGMSFISFSVNAQEYRIVKDNIACLYGLKDADGNWKIEPQYMQMEKMGRAGCYKVMQDSGWGVINHHGKIIIPLLFNDIRENNYQKNYLVKIFKDGNQFYGVYTWNGKIILNTIYHSIGILNKNYIINENNKYGLADTNGILIPPLYDKIELFESIKAIKAANYVKDSSNTYFEKCGLLNWHGDTLIPFDYSDIYYTSHGNLVLRKDAFWTILNNKLDTVLFTSKYLGYTNHYSNRMDFGFREILAFSPGKKWGFITGQGDIIKDTIFDLIEKFNEGANTVYYWKFKSGNKWGTLNSDGEISIPALYDDIRIHQWWFYDKYVNSKSNFVISIKKNGKYGLLAANGDTLIPPIYYGENYYDNIPHYYSLNDTIICLNFYADDKSSKLAQPEIYPLSFFSAPDSSVSIYKNKNEFVFVTQNSKNKDEKNVGSTRKYMQLKRNIYEIDWGRKKYYIDKRGNLTTDPFENKTIIHDLKTSVIYKNEKEFYGLADTNGVDLLDTTYQKLFYFGNSIWIRTEKNKNCRFIANYYTASDCFCGWLRYNKNGKRMDDLVYDYPTEDVYDIYYGGGLKESAVIYTNDKAGLYDFTQEKMLIQPIYKSISPFNYRSGDLLAANIGDSVFVVYNTSGRMISKKKWKYFIPIEVNEPEKVSNLAKFKCGNRLYLLFNDDETLIMDEEGISLGKKVKKEKYLGLNDYSNDNFDDFFGPKLRTISGYEDSVPDYWINYFWNYIFTNYIDLFRGFPGGGEGIYGCGVIYPGREESPAFEQYHIVYADENRLSVRLPHRMSFLDTFTHVYPRYINFYKNENTVKQISFDSLFHADANVAGLMNGFILEDLANRDDLNLDCSNTTSFYMRTNGDWYFSENGVVVEVKQPYFTSVIPWEKLLPYQNENKWMEIMAGE